MSSRIRKQIWPVGNHDIGVRETGVQRVPLWQNHAYCADSIHPGPPYFTGGDLSIDKLTIGYGLTRTDHHVSQTSAPAVKYDGRFYALPYFPASVPHATDLTVWGTRGWYRALPVHDLSGIARFIGELKDAPEMVKSTQAFFHQFRNRIHWRNRSASYWADAFLNESFGWAPFISDLFSIISLGDRYDRAVNRYIRLNGKPIHREFTMDEQDYSWTEDAQSGVAGIRPILASELYNAPTSSKNGWVVKGRYQRRIWFSGSFMFHIKPEMFYPSRFRSRLFWELSGVMPDLSVVYELVPWTWLFDWFTDVNLILRNLSLMNKYHQVAKYAYVLCHEKTSYTRVGYSDVRAGTAKFASSLPSSVISCTSTVEYEFKRRVAASPYGFGFAWDGFSPYQLSILTALGLSRAK